MKLVCLLIIIYSLNVFSQKRDDRDDIVITDKKSKLTDTVGTSKLDTSCAIGLKLDVTDYRKLLAEECRENLSYDVCKCYESKKNNIFVSAGLSDFALEQQIVESLKSDRDHLVKAYFMMTVGEAYGKLSLGMDLEDRQVGCPPELLIDNYNKQIGQQASDEKKFLGARKDKIVEEYDEHLQNILSADKGKAISSLGKEKTIKDLFNMANKQILTGDLREKFECFPMSEYMLSVSAPSKNFLDLITGPYKNNVAELLKLPSPDDSDYLVRKDFLRRNPLIVKLAALGNVDGMQDKLVGGLVKMASVPHNDRSQVLDTYLSFMQNEVNEMQKTKNGKTANAYMCEKMATSLMALAAKKEVMKTDDKDNALIYSIMNCRIEKYNKALKSDFDPEATLQENPYWGLTDGDDFYEQDSKKWKDNQLAYCHDVEKLCKSSSNKSACVEEKLAKSSDPQVQEYLSLREVFKKHIIPKNITQNQIDRANKVNDINSQDMTIVETYKKEIAPRMKTPTLVRKGAVQTQSKRDEAGQSFSEALNSVNNNQIASASPSSSSSNYSTSKSSSFGSPGWMQDPGNQMGSITPESIAKGASAILPPNFSNYTPVQKMETINNAQAVIGQKLPELINPLAPKPTDADLKSQINKLQQQLEEVKKGAADQIAAESSGGAKGEMKKEGSGGQGFSATPQNQVPTTVPVFIPGSNPSASFANSSAFPGNEITKSSKVMSDAQYNNAKLQTMYANKDGEGNLNDRKPASVEMGKIIVSDHGVSNLPEEISVTSSLKVSTSDFKNKKSLEAKLNAEISRMKLPLKEGMIFEVTSSQNEKKYYNASWVNDAWIFSPYTKEAQEKIVRKNQLQNLRSTLITP